MVRFFSRRSGLMAPFNCCKAGIASPEAIEVLVFQWFWFADGELNVAVPLLVAPDRRDSSCLKKVRTNCEVPFSQELFANGITIPNCQQVFVLFQKVFF
jgi:hypothetical protein